MRQRRFLARLGATGFAATVILSGLAAPAQAAEPLFQVPFPCDQVWTGDNPSSNAHTTPWEIDFNLANGQDLGKPVHASAAGTVEIATYQKKNGYGNLVKIRHGSTGYYSYYAHLKDMAVSIGDVVTQGELVGWVGDTSETNPGIKPHLHYEVRSGGSIVPAKFNGVRFPYPSGSVTSRNCGATALKAAKSINGDRYDDALGIDGAGVAWVYHGKATGGFNAGVRLGSGWAGFARVALGDSNADGWADLFATQGSDLYYWHNRGNGSFSSATVVGGGWSAMEYFSVADVNGDNKADILARDGDQMYVYHGKGNGAFTVRDHVGAGWAGLLRHTGADADGDGDGDIWGTNSLGELVFWRRDGAGYATAVEVGSGWNAFDQMTTMDVNGDNKADIVAVKSSDNTLWQWLGTGAGTFGHGTNVGSGWADYRLATY
jgi:hypothetical protein